MGLRLIQTLSSHTEDRVWHASWSRDGQFLATCGEDKTIRVWVLKEIDGSFQLANIAVLEDGQSRTIRHIDWSPDGLMICSASFDGTVAVWEAQSKELKKWDLITSLEGHENEVKCAIWSISGRLIATCGRDKRVWIWEQLNHGEFECVTMLEGHTQDVKSLVWHPNEKVLFSASYDNTIKVWVEESDDWYCSDTLKAHESTVWALSLSACGRKLASVSDDLSVKVWVCRGDVDEQNAWECCAILKNAHMHPIYSVDWSHHHGHLVSAGGDNTMNVYHLEGNDGYDMSIDKESGKAQAHDADINCVKWNPDPAQTHAAHLLVSSGDDGKVHLWRFDG